MIKFELEQVSMKEEKTVFAVKNYNLAKQLRYRVRSGLNL